MVEWWNEIFKGQHHFLHPNKYNPFPLHRQISRIPLKSGILYSIFHLTKDKVNVIYQGNVMPQLHEHV